MSVVTGHVAEDQGYISANFLLHALCTGVKWPQRKSDHTTTFREDQKRVELCIRATLLLHDVVLNQAQKELFT
jgi:hypothetical protein